MDNNIEQNNKKTNEHQFILPYEMKLEQERWRENIELEKKLNPVVTSLNSVLDKYNLTNATLTKNETEEQDQESNLSTFNNQFPDHQFPLTSEMRLQQQIWKEDIERSEKLNLIIRNIDSGLEKYENMKNAK